MNQSFISSKQVAIFIQYLKESFVFSTDNENRVGDKFIRRHVEVLRRRSFANSATGVVVRAVARAVVAAEIIALVSHWHAAEMRADADDDEPFFVFHTLRVGFRVA